jgi:hypothetical protein
MLAEGAVAEEVLRRFCDYSAPFGTRIEVSGGCGVVRL